MDSKSTHLTGFFLFILVSAHTAPKSFISKWGRGRILFWTSRTALSDTVNWIWSRFIFPTGTELRVEQKQISEFLFFRRWISPKTHTQTVEWVRSEYSSQYCTIQCTVLWQLRDDHRTTSCTHQPWLKKRFAYACFSWHHYALFGHDHSLDARVEQRKKDFTFSFSRAVFCSKATKVHASMRPK